MLTMSGKTHIRFDGSGHRRIIWVFLQLTGKEACAIRDLQCLCLA